jgi:hypothetical protein
VVLGLRYRLEGGPAQTLDEIAARSKPRASVSGCLSTSACCPIADDRDKSEVESDVETTPTGVSIEERQPDADSSADKPILLLANCPATLTLAVSTTTAPRAV